MGQVAVVRKPLRYYRDFRLSPCLASRWRLIKMGFSKAVPKTERLSKVRVNRSKRGIRNDDFGSILFVTTPTLRHAWITSISTP